jgi:tetratricopeptide (TPR) repeat protein
MFYPQLKEHKDFVDELTELEALYYTIKDRVADRDKINNVLQRSFKMIEKCPNFFNPWFYYGNTLAILERYNEAMAAYLEAMKYDSTRGNYARLIHNLLVCYLTLKQYDQAVLLIKNIDVGLKTYPHISQLIRQVEQLTGQHLLA